MSSVLSTDEGLFKDAVLDDLAASVNVAQFASFGPGTDPTPRFSRIRGRAPNVSEGSIEDTISTLIESTVDHSVNVRSYHPHQPRSNEFLYGLTDVSEAAGAIRRLAGAGLYTIANETVDVNDGGVSGVAYAGVLEFAPKDTPRCVEKPGTTALSRQIGLKLLEKVYGFIPALDYKSEQRVEFSIHPMRRGFQHEHTIIWELEEIGPAELPIATRWPNHFSRLLGDKAFGLLVADSIALPVPRTTVVGRSVAPFTFGMATSTGENWLRTCPVEQAPGLFTTHPGWTDPFELLKDEDPSGALIASVLRQDGVEAAYSGALLTDRQGRVSIEGVAGSGEDFMLGRASPERLPKSVVQDVGDIQARASKVLGPVRMEWVHDGSRVWVVQLHASAAPGKGDVLYPGDVATYRRFVASDGIETLRQLIEEVGRTGEGIIVEGNIGVTSHIGDLLRRAQVPSKLQSSSAEFED